jgi:archaellin
MTGSNLALIPLVGMIIVALVLAVVIIRDNHKKKQHR